MLYVLYIGTQDKFQDVKEKVVKVLGDGGELLRDLDQEFAFACESFSIKLKKGGQAAVFASKDYDLDLSYQFWFDIYHYAKEWMNSLMKFIGGLMEVIEGDAIVFSNGDTPVLMRKKGIVVVVTTSYHFLNLDVDTQ